MQILKKWLYLDIFPKLPLFLTMTLLLHCGRWWTIVYPPSDIPLNSIKDVPFKAACSLILAWNYTPWVHLINPR